MQETGTVQQQQPATLNEWASPAISGALIAVALLGNGWVKAFSAVTFLGHIVVDISRPAIEAEVAGSFTGEVKKAIGLADQNQRERTKAFDASPLNNEEDWQPVHITSQTPRRMFWGGKAPQLPEFMDIPKTLFQNPNDEDAGLFRFDDLYAVNVKVVKPKAGDVVADVKKLINDTADTITGELLG